MDESSRKVGWMVCLRSQLSGDTSTAYSTLIGNLDAALSGLVLCDDSVMMHYCDFRERERERGDKSLIGKMNFLNLVV